MARRPFHLSQRQARACWISAQKLDHAEPFGDGPEAVRLAVEHLGYVQIDTINVIERCHHHILFNRIPRYRRRDLAVAQSVDKTVFEYWTHALSYVPTRDLKFFLPAMKDHRDNPVRWSSGVAPEELKKAIARVRREGPLSIRDIDEEPVEKEHLWASRKPSKKALQRGFYNGRLAIAGRTGMVKTYDLMERHFGWERAPRPATKNQIIDYLIDRSLTAQGIVSLDSICYLAASKKAAVAQKIEQRVRARKLLSVSIQGDAKTAYWARPETIEQLPPTPELTHILSPFDPLIIQRKRTAAFFSYEHLFEAYVTKEKRKLGYFALPVLCGDEIVAAIDLKADRQQNKLLIQNWVWTDAVDPERHKPIIDEALGRFERFQLAYDEAVDAPE
ncbi:hypothetical protein GCM10007908_32110 [Rhizobium albus]|nr:hypothetical protein GCM10007908_32110 [Rhizobium albus]